MFRVSQSKINTGRRCLQAFKYKYHDRLRRKAKARPLQFGSIMHELIEVHVEGKDPFKKLDEIAKQNVRLFREEREAYGEIVADAGYIMRGYLEHWKKDPLVMLPHDGKKAEIEFEIELTTDIVATGKLDGVAKSRKMNWLVEHKNNKQFPDADHRWRNLQSAVYIRFIEMLGWWSLEGTLWDYIRSKPPTRPELLKSGKLSEKRLDSLPQVVIDTIKKHKLNPRDYKDLIDSQTLNMSTWYQRVYTPTKKAVVDNLVRDFTLSARHLRDTNFDKPVPRSIDKHCTWCEFEPLCRAALQGSDEDYVKEHEYVIRKDEAKETTEEETRD
jgi:hypothetical protein